MANDVMVIKGVIFKTGARPRNGKSLPSKFGGKNAFRIIITSKDPEYVTLESFTIYAYI